MNKAYFALFSMGAHFTGMTPGYKNTDFHISIDGLLGAFILFASQCMHFPIHKMHIR